MTAQVLMPEPYTAAFLPHTSSLFSCLHACLPTCLLVPYLLLPYLCSPASLPLYILLPLLRQTLEKTFYIDDPKDLVPRSFEGTPIDWAKGKDTTVTVVKRKVAVSGRRTR